MSTIYLLWATFGMAIVCVGILVSVWNYDDYRINLATARAIKNGEDTPYYFRGDRETAYQRHLNEAKDFQRWLRWGLATVACGLLLPLVVPVAFVVAVVYGCLVVDRVVRAAFATIPPEDWDVKEENDESSTEPAEAAS